jgi:hypothetical protein
MASIIVSPLDSALYGSEVVANDNKMKIHKPEIIDEEVDNENVLRRLIARLLTEIRTGNREEGDILYDTIMSNVIACKTFTSRHIGRCYITNKNYGPDCEGLLGYMFDGAQTSMGEGWFLCGFPYHESAKMLIPFVEMSFNYSEYMVPVCDFPNVPRDKNYIGVRIMRSNGAIQRGIIKTNRQSMVQYRVIENSSFVHPSWARPGSHIRPIVTVHFNSDYTDADVESAEVPFTDGTKKVPLDQLIDAGELFQIDGAAIPDFRTAIIHSVSN